jgi:hypothetical protein
MRQSVLICSVHLFPSSHVHHKELMVISAHDLGDWRRGLLPFALQVVIVNPRDGGILAQQCLNWKALQQLAPRGDGRGEVGTI